MPRIFDNIDTLLLPALQETLKLSYRADFCVGYFNLRGWRLLDSFVDAWPGGDGACCRLLVGMQRPPGEGVRRAMHGNDADAIDNQTALGFKKQIAKEFSDQLAWGFPTNVDEAGLHQLSAQIRANKVIVKLFLRHPLHAKLYLCHRIDPNNPMLGVVGSSNLTLAGLSKNGELNVDVLDHDACAKLQKWFDDRWNDRWCIDISSELAELIDKSWARQELISPYLIYLKMAYHLSQEARLGLAEFSIPHDFANRLLEFQVKAVKIAARHVSKRGGVILGDVVGLGKTLMATALARILEDQGTETLIICPKNLVTMWQDHVHRYRLRAAYVLPISRVLSELSDLRRYRVVLIDESHNLRNREGKRFKAIQDYIAKNDSKCILLSATPYNKTYLDLSAQLRLFLPEDKDLGIRPERKIREVGEAEFVRQHQRLVRTLAAFEKSEYPEDWRELMRRFLVRRTRSFIQANYAIIDETTGAKYLAFEDGTRSYFPTRVPKTVKFKINDKDKTDAYARLFSALVVDAINSLHLPRYGLGNYVAAIPAGSASVQEVRVLRGLSRAGKRLMGFCRTNLFKRLESDGASFLLSIARHVVRNYVVLHAVAHALPLPLGAQDVDAIDEADEVDEADIDPVFADSLAADESAPLARLRTAADFKHRAEQLYHRYSTELHGRFSWIRPRLFARSLQEHLEADCAALLKILTTAGEWDPDRDAKLDALHRLVTKSHPSDKVLVFSQYADTARYLGDQLRRRGVTRLEVATGESEDLAALAWQFSPESNDKRTSVAARDEVRVLIATDVLSEGLNLQDCAIVVNFDLPWAIVRLTQRAGRIDRIGQKASSLLCYSFLPAQGVERIIRLRRRVRQRLRENAELLGSDEMFFDDDRLDRPVLDLYHEKAGILDGDDGGEVDLASYAYQVWKNATDRDPTVKGKIEALPNVVYSSKDHLATGQKPHGALVYMRTSEDNDALVWISDKGESVSHSNYDILRMAECSPETPARARADHHHDLVARAVAQVTAEERNVGGQLGRRSGTRSRVYERLMRYHRTIGSRRDLFVTDQLVRSLEKALDEIYRHPLRAAAKDALTRQLRDGINDEQLTELVLMLQDNNELCMSEDQTEHQPPVLICSLGLVESRGG